MRYITTTDTNITFTDVDGKVKIVPKNRVYTHFNVDTVTFLLIERYDNEGICLFSTKASDLQINGETYTYQELLDGEGISDLFSPTGLSFEVVEELPQSGEEGTIYLVPNDHDTYTEYIWIVEEEKWEAIGDSDIDLSNYYTKSQVDALIPTNVSAFTNDAGYLTQHQSLDNYYTKTQVDTALSGKQDTLTAGTGISIQNNVISATGGGGTQVQSDWNQSDSSAVDYIKNKPTIPAAQVNADWNASSGVAQILNKPTIPDYQFYNETDEEQEEGTTIRRHKSGMIEITDEGGTIDSGMGTSYEEIEEDGSITYTNLSSSMYADKDDGEGTVNGSSISVNYNYASMSVTEDGEDNGTPYSKYTDFFINADGLTVEINKDESTETQLELNDNGLSINGDKIYTKSEVDAELAEKQDTLTAGIGITIDANNVISASELFAGASYDSSTKHIDFYNDNDDLISYIDATAFIKDGMVDTVAIQNGNLVITFNTDAGKQPISIPLTDIFNPANYYDKIATDTLLSAKANSSSLATVATSGSYNDLTNKPTIPTVPTNVSAFTNDAGYLTQHQSLADYYTKTQVDTALSAKQDTLTAGTGIDITNNVISATGGTQVQSDWNQSDSSAVDYIKNKPTIPDTSDFVTKAEYNPKEVAIANALTQLNDNKADKTELPDTSTFATKTELNGKQDTLTAGQNITIQNNVISATGGGGTQVQSDWNQSDSSAVDYIKNKPTIPAAQVNADWNASSGVAQILNKPTIPTVPTNVSSFTNDAHYVPSSDNTIQNIVKKEQSEYDTLVNNSQVDPNTLYIIVPNSI